MSALSLRQIALQIAYKLDEIATRQGNVPFETGELSKSHVVEPRGAHDALLSANTPYARAVHDGRPAITIKPKKRKGAAHPVRAVHQPARKGNPWLARAVAELEREGLDFLAPEIGQQVADELAAALRARGLKVRR